jgi:hypothetical protein
MTFRFAYEAESILTPDGDVMTLKDKGLHGKKEDKSKYYQ